MTQSDLILLVLSGVAWIAVFATGLVIFLRWAARDRANRR